MIARSTNTSSEFGAKLDTIADFVFIVVCMLKMIPVLNLENWMYIWIIIIGIIKIINIISGYVMWHKFISFLTEEADFLIISSCKKIVKNALNAPESILRRFYLLYGKISNKKRNALQAILAHPKRFSKNKNFF